MRTLKKHDIVILGGGVAGLTLAAFLARAGLNIGVVEASLPSVISTKFDNPDHYAARVSAINLASQNLFDSLGVWHDILNKRVSPFTHMFVFEEKNSAFLDFDCYELSQEQLGFIIENDVLTSSLFEYLKKFENIEFYFEKKPLSLASTEETVTLNLPSETLETKLLIGADGRQSWLRQQLGMIFSEHDYKQKALVATIKTSLPHQKTAYQRFLKDSILAFLPLNHLHYSSIVWSLASSEAERLKELNTKEFNQCLTQALNAKLGEAELVSERFVYSLKKLHAQNYIQPRIALVADAIHTIHPLAGQGLNLGLQDVKCLADVILNAVNKNLDIGSYSILREYERNRKFDNTVMANSMSALKWVFSYQDHFFGFAHQLGLGFIQRCSWIKNFFASKAMG